MDQQVYAGPAVLARPNFTPYQPPQNWSSLQFPQGQMPDFSSLVPQWLGQQQPQTPQYGPQQGQAAMDALFKNFKIHDVGDAETLGVGNRILDDPLTQQGLTPAQAHQVEQNAFDSWDKTGQRATPEQYSQWMNQASQQVPQGATDSATEGQNLLNRSFQAFKANNVSDATSLGVGNPILDQVYQQSGLSPEQAHNAEQGAFDAWNSTHQRMTPQQAGQLLANAREGPYPSATPPPGPYGNPWGNYTAPGAPPQVDISQYPNAYGGYQNPYGANGQSMSGPMYNQYQQQQPGMNYANNLNDWSQGPNGEWSQEQMGGYANDPYQQRAQLQALTLQSAGSTTRDPMGAYSQGDNTGAYKAPSPANPNDGSGGGSTDNQDQTAANQQQDQTQQYMDNLPDPNRIVGRNWAKMSQPDQDFLHSAYGQKGFYQGDVDHAIQAGLPSQKASYGQAGQVTE